MSDQRHRIHLDASACDRALGVAVARDTESRAQHLNAATSVGTRPQKRLEESVGALAEVAFAQFIGDYDFVPGVNTFGSGDVKVFEVKGTTYEHGVMYYRPWENAPDRAYVLVTIPAGIGGAHDGSGIDAYIVGWYWGFDCVHWPLREVAGAGAGGRQPHEVPQRALWRLPHTLFCCA